MDKAKLVVAVATAGRPAILDKTLTFLAAQARLPDRVLVCPASRDDLPASFSAAELPVSIVYGKRGLPAQRNALLAAASDCDILIFFDDDFFAEPVYLAETAALFEAHRDVVMATGTVIADGILGPGLANEVAVAALAGVPPMPAERLEDVYNGYGCNMALRMTPVRSKNLRFDETLPLYGWLEDVDFSRRLAPAGRIVRSARMRGVHLGNKSGRASGVRLGYSQIANPIYMVRKGTLERGRAYRQIGRNVLANAWKLMRPEPWIDRRGRLKGNALAAFDAFRGRLDPRRILSL